MKLGFELVKKECRKQKKKYSREHDQKHKDDELLYASTGLIIMGVPGDNKLDDIWGLQKKYKNDRIKQLTIAAALLCSEIDRLNNKSGDDNYDAN